jgi:hypothetical protein
MNRRTFLKAGAVAAPASVVAGKTYSHDGGRPNILMLMADQHRADCMGAYGNHVIQTPHMDALARDGVLFRTLTRLLLLVRPPAPRC